MRYLRRPDEREQTGILSRARARHGDSRTRKARKRLLALLAALAVGVTAPAAHAYTGRVIDAETRQPIPGALVTLHDKVVLTDADGRFEIDGTAATLGFRAYGYQRSSIATEHFDKGLQDVYLAPFTPRALYMSFYGIGDRTLRESALQLIDKTSLNALVIDVKGDRGMVTYRSEVPLAKEIGAQDIIIYKNMRPLLTSLREKGIYTIARIVVFKDTLLASRYPELAVRDRNGEIWYDREKLAWVDPFRTEAWDYNIALAAEAARMGFDEIQFDYVRFPDAVGVTFSQENTEQNRVRAITEFLAQARQALIPYNVFVAADIFGYVPWNASDTSIGQRLEDLMPVVDYLSPMLYPSGFQFGIPGCRDPVMHPYEVVYRSLKKAQERAGLHPARLRPWLQAFRDYAFDRRLFGNGEIRAQIMAAENFGAGGWMLWNPRNVYSALLEEETSARLEGETSALLESAAPTDS